VEIEEGENLIVVEAWDAAGNYIEVNRTVYLDRTPPSLRVIDPKDGSVVKNREIKMTGFIESRCTLKINGVEVAYSGTTFTYILHLAEGSNTVTLEAWDAAGNYNSLTVTVYVDVEPPALTILFPGDNYVTGENAVLVSGETDMWATVKINNVPVEVTAGTGYFEKSVFIRPGVNRITVVATDSVGNSVTRVINVLCDKDPPVLKVISPDNGTVTSEGTIGLSGITENNTRIFLNGEEIPVKDGRFSSFVSLIEGLNEIVVMAEDGAGNKAYDRIFIIRDSSVRLKISYPYNYYTTIWDTINITGSTDIDAVVMLNDVERLSYDRFGSFKKEVRLEYGTNIFNITATDPLGNKANTTLVVIRNKETSGILKEEVKTLKQDNGKWYTALGAMGIILLVAVGAAGYVAKRKGDKVKELEDMLMNMKIQQAQALQLQTQVASQPDETQGFDVEAHPGVVEVRAMIEDAKNRGYNTYTVENTLNVAKSFLSKGNVEKGERYLQKARSMLEEMR